MKSEKEDLVWRPKISVKSVANTISDIHEKGKQIIDNTLNDVDFILGNVEDCARGCGRALDKIRLRLTHRAIQYASLVIGATCSNGLIPTDIIKTIYDAVEGDLSTKRKPRLLYLTNPKESVWQIPGGPVVRPKFEDVNPNTVVLNKDKEHWIFIHGMLYKAVKKDGSDFSSEGQIDVFDFFANFELEARVFNPDTPNPHHDPSKVEIYLVSYDSEMRDEDEEIISTIVQSYVIGGGNFQLLVAAVYWREMKRRAIETANYIKPFLDKLAEKDNNGIAVTHSLGCYVLAHAAQQSVSERQIFQERAFLSWWCMSPALPSDAFSNTGDYPLAPRIAGHWDGVKLLGTNVFYSLLDYVLMLLYPLGACTTALGLTGLGVNDNEWATDYDITKITDVTHGPGGGYFARLGSIFRNFLRTGN